jgi:diguanylate cyclase (GGDEF)-like protein/PAS domain S-box-containing protein
MKKAIQQKNAASAHSPRVPRKNALKPVSTSAATCVPDYLLTKDIVFINAAEGIMVADTSDAIVSINPAFTVIMGLSEKETIGKKSSFLFSDNKKTYLKMHSSLKKSGHWQGEIWKRKQNGENRPLLLTAVADNAGATKTRRSLYFITDIALHIGNNTSTRNHAYYDTLTGLPNRLLLVDRLRFMINRCRRNKSFLALVLLDLNRFHSINDTLGYAIGDKLLQSMATRLKTCVRDVDTVFRLGDDEFALILEGISQPEDASLVARRIINTCSSPFRLANREVYITVSIGIGICPSDGETVEMILTNSQAALLRAKDYGINHFQHYQRHMNAKVLEEFTLENDLRKALELNQLIVHYQPQVNLDTNEILGAEALIRWAHPQLGMVSPSQFVHLAEANGLIISIGEWILQTACAQAKKWQEQFSPKFTIAVNLSNRQFQQQDLVTMVDRALKETGLDPHTLELEITESMGMKNPEATLKTLQELKAMGVNIAIDDFGTGYSSIYYLKRFPIDSIKIDRSFVDDIVTDPNDATIVLAMLALANSLKISVIAEGVENKEQLSFLSKNGCRRIQGYFFSRPVGPDGFEQLLADPLLIKNRV